MTKYRAEVTLSFTIEFEDNSDLALHDQAFQEADSLIFMADIPNVEDIEIGRIEVVIEDD